MGQVSRGLGARAPRAWGPAHQGPAFSPQKTTNLRFFRKPPGGSLAKAWVSAETAASEVGTWRETKPGYPPYPPPNPPAFWGCKGERKRVFTLSAFGNHPTRPPRSADTSMHATAKRVATQTKQTVDPFGKIIIRASAVPALVPCCCFMLLCVITRDKRHPSSNNIEDYRNILHLRPTGRMMCIRSYALEGQEAA